MSKYFYDCEFLEGTQKKKFWWGNTVPTIDLISIGIVSEDGREYYAISKDFNLKEAWNRFDVQERTPYEKQHGFSGRKIYWIRENVLKPIFMDLLYKFNPSKHDIFDIKLKDFTYRNLSKLIKKYGKTNKQIAKDICSFIDARGKKDNPNAWFYPSDGSCYPKEVFTKNVELYGYYSAYDHVALCWLFGKMIDLPKGFPMYTIDLKQTMDEYVWKSKKEIDDNGGESLPFDYALDFIKRNKNYPKQTNEHNSLSDAKFNFELYKFLKQ